MSYYTLVYGKGDLPDGLEQDERGIWHDPRGRLYAIVYVPESDDFEVLVTEAQHRALDKLPQEQRRHKPPSEADLKRFAFGSTSENRIPRHVFGPGRETWGRELKSVDAERALAEADEFVGRGA